MIATIYRGDCLAVLPTLPSESFDVVCTDPPYELSDGGSTCRGGKRVSVDKGAWDRPFADFEAARDFHMKWLSECRRVLRPSGTIWISGTHHVIFVIGAVMQELGYEILNTVIWEKPNPPPNLSCRYLTHNHEILIWASPYPKKYRQKHKIRYVFNYEVLREQNDGKQMKAIWRIQGPRGDERGYHPTQKPIALIDRILTASLRNTGSVRVLDPFMGSGTTGVALARREDIAWRASEFVGIEMPPATTKKTSKSSAPTSRPRDYARVAARRLEKAGAHVTVINRDRR